MGYTGQAAVTNNLAELDDCFAKSLSTGKEVLSLWELDNQSCQNKSASALELKAFLEGCGCFALTSCLLHFQKRTSVGCIYRQTISSGDTSYQVHRIAVLGSLPRKALVESIEKAEVYLNGKSKEEDHGKENLNEA